MPQNVGKSRAAVGEKFQIQMKITTSLLLQDCSQPDGGGLVHLMPSAFEESAGLFTISNKGVLVDACERDGTATA